MFIFHRYFLSVSGSLPKFNAYSSEIFEHNAVSVNYLRANSTYFSPKQQIYYHPEIFFVEPGCQNLEYLLQEVSNFSHYFVSYNLM